MIASSGRAGPGRLGAALLLVLATGSVARADSAAAEALFERGKELMQQGKIDEACAKFEESYRLDPGGGVLMNLAMCHEQQGRVATAWVEFKQALALAVKAGRADREQYARGRVEELGKVLPRLTVVVPEASRVSGLEVRRGGALLGAGSWGEALPVDPGRLVVSARAPGYRERTYEVTIKPGEQRTVTVERLDPQPAAPASSGPPLAPPPATSAPPVTASASPVALATASPTTDGPSTRRMVGYAVGGAGVLALWVGGVFGVRAILKRQDSDDDCPGGACNARGWATYEKAQEAARYANAGLALGVVGVGVGTWLVLTSQGETAVAVGPSGVSLRGSW